MSTLLEDLVRETSASNRRVADRLDAEARELGELRQTLAKLDELRQHCVESARQATDIAVFRARGAEGLWQAVLTKLRTKPPAQDAERLLRLALDLFENDQQLAVPARALWALAQGVGVTPEPLDDLDRAEGRLKAMYVEAKQALDHRLYGWTPQDPVRLAAGLQQAREGKTVRADEARARFRRSGG